MQQRLYYFIIYRSRHRDCGEDGSFIFAFGISGKMIKRRSITLSLGISSCVFLSILEFISCLAFAGADISSLAIAINIIDIYHDYDHCSRRVNYRHYRHCYFWPVG